MIETGSGEVTITNDGATILNQMSVIHPTAKMVCNYCLDYLFNLLYFLRFDDFLAGGIIKSPGY